MFSEEWKIRASECDKYGSLKPYHIVDYFQDATNSESIGGPMDAPALKERNRAWIIDFWQIVINRRPKRGENVVISTWPHGFKSFVGYRNFTMTTKDGEMLAMADSNWVYVDTINMRPVRLNEEELSLYKLDESLPMEKVGRKIDIPCEMEIIDKVRVGYHNLDTNNHMNNARYFEIAFDYIPQDCEITSVLCQYKKEFLHNEMINVYRKITDGCVIIAFRNDSDELCTAMKIYIK